MSSPATAAESLTPDFPMSLNMDVFVHRRSAGVWQPVFPSQLKRHWRGVLRAARVPYVRTAWAADEWNIGQNADAYAILTGIIVSGVGGAGEPYSTVSPTRGLPSDVSLCPGDGDMGSWATLEELERFDWGRRVRRWGYCNGHDFKAYIASGGVGEPASYARGVGERVQVISAEEARARLAARGELAPRGSREERFTRVRVDFEITHAEAVGPVHDAILPLVRTLDADPADVRLTFHLY